MQHGHKQGFPESARPQENKVSAVHPFQCFDIFRFIHVNIISGSDLFVVAETVGDFVWVHSLTCPENNSTALCVFIQYNICTPYNQLDAKNLLSGKRYRNTFHV